MSDLIERQAAIDALDEEPAVWDEKDDYEQGLNSQWHHDVNAIKAVPSAQPEPSTEIQEILEYLDTTLHSIVSPDNWNVYAKLHDMVSKLPSAQQEIKPHRNYKYLSDYWCTCGWHLGKKGEVKYCADCGRKVKWDD